MNTNAHSVIVVSTSDFIDTYFMYLSILSMLSYKMQVSFSSWYPQITITGSE